MNSEITPSEIFQRLDPAKATYFPYEVVLATLDIHEYSSVNKVENRLMAYHVSRWQSSDEWVGLTAITFDNRPLAFAYRTGRKSDYDIQFVSQEIADELYAAAVPQAPAVTLLDMDKKYASHFRVEFGSDILDDDGYYRDEPVKIIQKFSAMTDTRSWRKLLIRDQNGNEKLITTDHFKIPLTIDWNKKID